MVARMTPDATTAPGVVMSDPLAIAARVGATSGRPGAKPIPAAPPVTPVRPGLPPIAILVDYDGTIALTDVSDTVMAEHVSHADWERIVAIYDAGRMGSRRLMEWEITLIRATEAELLATAAAQPHDSGFAPFARRATAAGIPVEVVSDGFGFFIGPALARLGLADLPIVTARTTFNGRQGAIEWPNGHPSCRVCGTCKRQRVLDHQAAGRAVLFIGDGESDRYAAGYADLIFAKRALVPICLANGWPYERWTEFSEIHAWLNGRLDAWRRDPAGAFPAPAAHPIFCGPEVWGEGVEDPPGAERPPGEA
jgi:2-hydroxy-3-keto-5-methylthiopentenyl-1-phosphate phosphatase